MPKPNKRARLSQSKFYRLYQAVREILFREWDPIGVNCHAPADEYDSYAPGICRLLEAGADEVRLTEHLHKLATESMGLSNSDREHHRRIARRLLSLTEADKASGLSDSDTSSER